MTTTDKRPHVLSRSLPAIGREPSPHRLPSAARIVLGVVAWAACALAVAIVTMLLFVSGLGVALVRSPALREPLVFVAALAVAALTYWLLTKYVSPKRFVRRVVAIFVTAMLFGGAVWAASARDQAVFLARSTVWGDSDVLDYQKFPARTVANAPPVFNFPVRLAPKPFQPVTGMPAGAKTPATFDDFLKSTGTTSFIVVKDGTVVYERYMNGYSRNSVVTSFSTAKSVTSALVGIANDEGYIHSVDDRIVEYLPEMRGRGLDGITIRDLLTMSTGIRIVHQDQKTSLARLWTFHDEALSYYYPDLRQLALRLPHGTQPVGAAFQYNQYYPLLLGMILERTTHQPATSFLQDKIWQPLGMQYPATWSLDSTKDGFEKMESGLNARAIDFAKFGQLFLDDGNWNGKQLISRQWVLESTTADPSDHRPWIRNQQWHDAGGYYKYMRWGMPTPDGAYHYMAWGHLGQYIAVFPSQKVVVVRFGTTDAGVDWNRVFTSVAAQSG